jgi:hypothetical protein
VGFVWLCVRLTSVSAVVFWYQGVLDEGYTHIINYKDVPGVMRAIDDIVSIGNVSYQTIRTGDGVGCVIADLKAGDSSSS